MARLLHAKSSRAVGQALKTASLLRTPFLLLVYSERCSHCESMMPAWNAAMQLMGPATCVLQLAVDALRQADDSGTKTAILQHVSSVPFIAMVSTAPRPKVVPLPNSYDRSVASLMEFATGHSQQQIRYRTGAGSGRPARTGKARRAAR